MYLFGLLTEKL